MTGRRGSDPRRLRERFRQDDTGNERITRKMSREDRIVRGERRNRFRENTGLALDQLAHENKRRAMRQTEKRRVRHNAVSHAYSPSSGFGNPVSPQPLTK